MRKTLDFTIDGLEVVLARRKGTKNLRVSIKSDGRILLSAPRLVSEKQAVDFLKSKQDWIKKHLKKPETLVNGSQIGKAGRVLAMIDDNFKNTVRLNGLNVVVQARSAAELESPEIQNKIRATAEKSLKKQAENLLPQRLKTLSQQTGLDYGDVSVRKLKSRWGSCDQDDNIVLNIYLIQLDWDLIDYVLIHELAHTVHKHHQAEFWDLVEQNLPDYKARRKTLKTHSTAVEPAN